MQLSNALLSLGAYLNAKILNKQGIFVSSFLQDGRVASITSSSPSACRNVCQPIDFRKAHVIVEFGGGIGAITRELLRRMKRDARLIVFETNPHLAHVLVQEVCDPRVTVLQADALDVTLMSRAMCIIPDVIVSGIPLSLIQNDSLRKLIRDCHGLLFPSGMLVLYQAWIPPFTNNSPWQEMVGRYFSITKVTHVWWNIPPLMVISSTANPLQPRILTLKASS